MPSQEKTPKQHQKWPNLYRWGIEDAQSGKPSAENCFVKDAAAAYKAGYKDGLKHT